MSNTIKYAIIAIVETLAIAFGAYLGIQASMTTCDICGARTFDTYVAHSEDVHSERCHEIHVCGRCWDELPD